MKFKITALFLLFVSFSCIGQEVKPKKMEEKVSTVPVEPLGLIKQRKPVGDFMPDFNVETDFLIAKIGNEQYTIKSSDLVPLVLDVSWMSSIPRWNAYISYYKEGRNVYTNAQYVLNIDPKNLDPKIFKKLKYHKEIIEDEAKYVAKRKELEKSNEGRWYERKRYFIEHETNKYFLYFIVHMPLTLAELTALRSKLADYNPAEYYRADGKEKFENSIKSRTIEYDRCEYYFASADDKKWVYRGYNANNEDQFLVPVKIYCGLTVDDCRAKFDAKAMQLFYGAPIGIYKGAEEKNEAYILEWFDY
ncbi:hypothetical protein [Pedobacter sp. Leaf41]|uniref:hypothetical protein n=1 Tax=Pedobacter sp. Leaf41 TaxID=1736218 RepID=UPI0007036039|nr:hypothetical protein [Pedobacter sp. Leaf41]